MSIGVRHSGQPFGITATASVHSAQKRECPQVCPSFSSLAFSRPRSFCPSFSTLAFYRSRVFFVRHFQVVHFQRHPAYMRGDWKCTTWKCRTGKWRTIARNRRVWKMQDWKMTDKILANSGQNYGVWKMHRSHCIALQVSICTSKAWDDVSYNNRDSA